jgi:hypothetical protein
MEGIDALARRRGKAKVQAGFGIGRHRALGKRDPIDRRVAAISRGRPDIHLPRIAERCEHAVVKAARALDITHPD